MRFGHGRDAQEAYIRCEFPNHALLGTVRHTDRPPNQNEDFVADKAGVDLLENVEIDTVLDDINEAISILLEWTGGMCELTSMNINLNYRMQMTL